jgi:hypothetical protein
MVTLKDHQQAMVDLLTSGSGIPASASRLAHAMHDVLNVLQGTAAGDKLAMGENVRFECTTPGLNDKALAADVEACRPKDTMFDRARAAERRVKELENTIKQLRESRAKQKAYADAVTAERDMYKLRCGYLGTEQAGCRKDDTQPRCLHARSQEDAYGYSRCIECGEKI